MENTQKCPRCWATKSLSEFTEGIARCNNCRKVRKLWKKARKNKTIIPKNCNQKKESARKDNKAYCCKCDKIKEINEFGVDSKQIDKVALYCNDCSYSPRREYMLKIKYNMSTDDYIKMLIAQNYMCAICYKKLDLQGSIIDKTNLPHVDHCHTTGLVRGILCSKCNTGIGFFKDDPKIIKNALVYIKNSLKMNKK